MRLSHVAIPLLVLAACTDSDAPTDHVQARTTQLVEYSSCSALETDLKQMVIHELDADIDRADWSWGYGAVGEGDSNGAAGGADDSGMGGGRQEGGDYSGTNNQVDGVDEAD